MANVTVYHDTKEYTVNNVANVLREMITEVGGANVVTFNRIGYDLDDSAPVNSKGIALGNVKVSSSGGLVNSISNLGVTGTFDEAGAFAANFISVLHRIVINEVFDHYLQIRPINEATGAVESPYDVP